MTRQRRKYCRVVPQLEGGEPSSQPQTGAGGSGWQIPSVQLNQGSLFKEIDKALSEDNEYRDKNYECQVTRDWGLQKKEEPQSGEAPKADEWPGDTPVVYEAQGTHEPEGTIPVAKVPLLKTQESRRAGERNRAESPTLPALIFDPHLTEEAWLSNIARADKLAAKIRAQRPIRRGKGDNTTRPPDTAILVVPDNTYEPQLAFSTTGMMLQQDLHVRSATVTVPAGESRMEGKARRFTAEEKGKGRELEPQPQPSEEPAGSVPKMVQIAETEQTVRASEPVEDTSTSILHELQKMRKEVKKLKQRERERESRTRDSMVPDEANRSMSCLPEGSRDVNTQADAGSRVFT
jgi:hypothetical protein